MNIAIAASLVAGSSILTHQLVEEIKKTGKIKSGLGILIVSAIINVILAIGWALWQHIQIDIGLIAGIGQVVLAALYHEWTKSNSTPDPIPFDAEPDSDEVIDAG